MHDSVDLENTLGKVSTEKIGGWGEGGLGWSKNWHSLACWEWGGGAKKNGARLDFGQIYA